MNFEDYYIPEPNSGCWLWLGSVFQQNGRGLGYGRYNDILAHRLSWTIHHGDPGERMVCHTCDNILCVNPDHLFLGDARVNSDDKVAKGRHLWGSGIPNSKLKEEQVLQIRKSNESQSKLAARFNVNQSAISNIKTGRTWAWLKEPM